MQLLGKKTTGQAPQGKHFEEDLVCLQKPAAERTCQTEASEAGTDGHQ